MPTTQWRSHTSPLAVPKTPPLLECGGGNTQSSIPDECTLKSHMLHIGGSGGSDQVRITFSRALFQARKLILMGCKNPPTSSWITHMGNILIMERYIYQHRGCLGRFERLWSRWLDTPGRSSRELVMFRLVKCPTEWFCSICIICIKGSVAGRVG